MASLLKWEVTGERGILKGDHCTFYVCLPHAPIISLSISIYKETSTTLQYENYENI